MTLKTSDELFALNGGRVTTLADFSLAAYDELDGDIAVNRLLSPGGTLTQGWHFLDLSELNLGPPNSGFRYAN
ncbi:MAG: hypothetical protein ACJ8ES_20690, partial [Xanthobacteraceae bacterium]